MCQLCSSPSAEGETESGKSDALDMAMQGLLGGLSAGGQLTEVALEVLTDL